MNSNNNSTTIHRTSGGGVSLPYAVGGVFAAYLSYTLGNPIGWNVIHFMFGWFYVLYLCCGCGGGMPEGIF